jgi:hypothetical protein
VDTSAWLGTVGTAVAFILTQEAMLAAAPVVLPLLALYASRQRERLAAAAERAAQLARLEELLLELQAEAADEVAAEVGAEVQGLLAALQQQQRSGLPSPEVTKLLRGLDGKLSAVEGSVVSTGKRGGMAGWWTLAWEAAMVHCHASGAALQGGMCL